MTSPDLAICPRVLHDLLAASMPLLTPDLRRQAKALDDIALTMLRRRRLMTDAPPVIWEHPEPGIHVVDGKRLQCRYSALSAAFLAVRDGSACAADFAAPGATAAAGIVRRALHRECLNWAVEHAPELVPVVLACSVSTGGLVTFINPPPGRRPVKALGSFVVRGGAAQAGAGNMPASQPESTPMPQPLTQTASARERIRAALALRRSLLEDARKRRDAALTTIAAGGEDDDEFSAAAGQAQALQAAIEQLESELLEIERSLKIEEHQARVKATAAARARVCAQVEAHAKKAAAIDRMVLDLAQALQSFREGAEALVQDALSAAGAAGLTREDVQRVVQACRFEGVIGAATISALERITNAADRHLLRARVKLADVGETTFELAAQQDVRTINCLLG